MNKKITKRALIVGASGGIGSAVTAHLDHGGWDVTELSRSFDGFDVGNPGSVQRCLERVDGPFDLIFVAIGILAPLWGRPEKSLSAIKADDMARVLAVNTIGPALILQHAPHLLPKDRRSVVGVLSARVGSIGDNQIGGWYSYRASKAGLNQIVRSAAIELGRTHKHSICVALHPGTVATPFTANYAGRHKTVSAGDAATNLVSVMETLDPAQSGDFFDYAGQPIEW